MGSDLFPPQFVGPPLGLTQSQQWTLFASAAQGRGTFLYSIPTQAADETRQILLSHPVVPTSGGVTGAIVSPDEQYVLFSSVVQGAGFVEQFSVNINGGGITKISPPIPPTRLNGVSITSYTFRPCGCSGTQSDMFWALLPTTQYGCNTGGNCAGAINEIWVNNRAGQARRINKPTGQLAGDPQNKFVVIPDDAFGLPGAKTVYNDYFVYSLNDGPNGLSDIRRLYVSDWAGNTWLVSLGTQIASSNGTFASPVVGRSLTSSCNLGGTYLVISDYAVSPLYQSLYIYNLDTKTIVGGNVISPALDIGGACTILKWGTDNTKLYFICTPAGSIQQKLYAFDVSKPTVAATVVNGDYGAAVAGTINVHGSSGDYLIYSQFPVLSATQTAIIAYNTKTGANRALYTTAAAGGSFVYEAVVDAAGTYTFPQYATLGTNAAYVWIRVTTPAVPGPVTTSFYAAALTATTENAAALVVQSDSISAFNGAICRSTAAPAEACATTVSCTCSGCPTLKCSGYVTFSVNLPSATNAQLHSSLHSGQSVVAFGATTNSAVSLWSTIYSSDVTNPEVPILLYQFNSGTSTNIFSSRINSAAQVALGPPNVAGGTVRTVRVSQNGKWVVFRSDTTAVNSQIELYVAPTDGSTVGQRVSPAGLVTTRTTDSSYTLTTDSKYVLFFVRDTEPSTRTLMFSATLATTPVVTDLTVNVAEAPVANNYVNNVIGTTSFHCSQTRFAFLANLPLSTNPTSLYTVPIAGGPTVNVGFRTTPISSLVWLKSYVAVWYQALYFTGGSNDVFVNTGAAFMVAPLAALLLLALF